MKKLFALIVLVLTLNTTAFAAISDVSYTYNEEYEQTLSSGYRCRAYSGELRFSVDDTDLEEAGCILYCFSEVYDYLPIHIPFWGDLSMENFSIRLGGLGFEATDYKIVPYYIKNGERIMGDEKTFSISENCMALANLRVAYEQIQKIEFNEKEQKILSYVLPAVRETIEAGESGKAEITKDYIGKIYPLEIATAKSLYKEMKWSEKSLFLKKLEIGIEKTAQTYIITNLY